MANLTAKELSALNDQLNYEQVLVKKYRYMSQQATETDLKTRFSSIADKHQQHFSTLLSFLQ